MKLKNRLKFFYFSVIELQLESQFWWKLGKFEKISEF